VTEATPPAGPTGFPPARLPATAYPRMALVLRIGLGLAVALILGSLAVLVAQHPGEQATATLPPSSTTADLNLVHLGHELLAGDPVAFLTLGLLVLVATPLVRVASGLYYFHRSREAAIEGVAFTVLLLLLLGLLVIGPLVR
jgi:uncharacterized membrane protein